MTPKELIQKFSDADEQRKQDAMRLLRGEAKRLAEAADVTPAELNALDHILGLACLDRRWLFAVMLPFSKAADLRTELSRLGGESALNAAVESASRELDAIDEQRNSLPEWDGSPRDAGKQNEERRQLGIRRSNAMQKRSEAHAALKQLRRAKDELSKLETAAV